MATSQEKGLKNVDCNRCWETEKQGEWENVLFLSVWQEEDNEENW